MTPSITPTKRRVLSFFYCFSSLLLHLTSASLSADRPWLSGVPTPLPFLSKEPVSHDTDLYHFGLPPDVSLGISTCSCILVSPYSNNHNDIILTRPYTPVSSRFATGYFTLLVKRYTNGAMSAFFDALLPGHMVMVRQTPGNIKIQYPFLNHEHEPPNCILMLAAGTGITPMYQALLRMFGKDEPTSNTTTRVILLLACRTVHYFQTELNDMMERFPNLLQVKYCTTSNRIDKELIQQTCQQQQQGIDKVFVCGPPSFYNDMCGPKHEQGTVTGILHELGFTPEQVVKF